LGEHKNELTAESGVLDVGSTICLGERLKAFRGGSHIFRSIGELEL